MGKYTGKSCRLIIMLSLTFAFFLVEMIYGHLTNSLALVSDSYHMLSDVVALLVGLASVRISKWDSAKNTYGWARAEVLGATINSVFLIALCFTIFVEAIQRVIHDDHIHNPDWMLYVGIVGLVVNLIGLVLFSHHSHGHSHGGGGHGHSHGFGGSSNKKTEAKAEKEGLVQSTEETANGGATVQQASSQEDVRVISPGSTAQLNMRAVFLHVLGDALGSVIVIISALIIKYVDADWKFKVDPAMSMAMVLIILCTTIPLLKQSAMILLQTAPTHIQVQEIQEKLISKVEGVLAVHEFHVWQLAGNRIIASAHIRCQNLRDYMRIAEEVKMFFHDEGIHSTTIQPEFVEFEEISGRDCVLECGPDKNCFPDTCCSNKKDAPPAQGVRLRTRNGEGGDGEEVEEEEAAEDDVAVTIAE
ncbi:hypothetical protein CAPTEDRAFT_151660 [Capitella teleta]|uniref:Zinc transporter 1 n=1 Tax=Capitella teleta TaxID=283909 RepID=R7TA79_CAPTE|nr:hypothetical protein CAPTEDRAFT_151660 [Capitella teleta]|eukprot:ELT90648.1 hypothetical protein CAPTEDRAFT_151660 [Capitella teleta]